MLTEQFTSACSDSVVSNMDTNRNCLRRTRGEEAEFSNQSIFSSMEKFVKAVQEMDETILVPCRLLDLKVGDATDTVKPDSKVIRRKEDFRSSMSSADLYNLYNMVNTVKNELLWGRNTSPADEGLDSPASVTTHKGHVRRPSTASVASTHSATSTLSDTDSEVGNENDSGIEGEESPKPDCTQHIAHNFRRHLYGLYHSLEQMTDAATYLTARYQNDVGDAV